jgi:hypothetical protein
MKASQHYAFQNLYARAMEAGRAAAAAITPQPMVVHWKSNGQEKQEVVADGVCGFAWVHFAGNTAFGRWAKANAGASKDYPNGLSFWIGDYNQSMTRKEAHAHAMAEVLQAGGIDAYARSRMD